MAKNLLIVESPTKSKTLKRFLGRGFSIEATIGHIIDLPKSKLGVDPDNGFAIDYEKIKGKAKVIKKIKDAAKKADCVYLAPDPDREGEAIAWHVATELAKVSKKIVRVTFNEITKKAVTEAIENPREINLQLVNAQQARRALDRLVGYKVSPFLWKTITYGLSAGRVQSVALRIICEREAEIDVFVIEEYWEIEALLSDKSKKQILSRLVKIDGEKPVITSEEASNEIVPELNESKFIVDKVKKGEKKRNAAPPFITSTLQQDAARRFYFSPKKTMMVAQQLYEGVELGDEGATGLITYMRTDSTRVAESAIDEVREYITDTYGKDFVPSKPNRFKTKKSSQDAHEAIRPSYLKYPPDQIKNSLTKDQFKLYSLIWNRFVASQMPPAIYDTTSVDIAAGKYLFRASAQALKFEGFLKVYEESKENGNGENGLIDSLPDMKEGTELKLDEIKPSQHFTKPPARYSQASLVKAMEADGIGRPSTYATIVSTLIDRKYVSNIERRLHPTDLGKTVNKILVDSFPDVFSVEFTAGMEDDLDKIEAGEIDWVKVMEQFYEPFNSKLAGLSSKEKEIKASLTKGTGEKCDKCGEEMVIKWGRNGQFMACSGYPKCKNTKPIGDEAEEAAAIETDEKCEKCSSPMVVKSGRFGKFLACSAYPECKTTKAISLGVKCPKDDCKGDVTEKRSKRGKVFYGCTKYPDCDFVSWYKPVNKECPECKNNYMFDKVSKVKGPYLSCPTCKHKIYTEKEPATK